MKHVRIGIKTQITDALPELIIYLCFLFCINKKTFRMALFKSLSLFLTAYLLVFEFSALSQKSTQVLSEIRADDLAAHVNFLASPLLQGRSNGDPGLKIALNYIVSQAKLLDLKPANGDSYLQEYSIVKKSIDYDKTSVQVFSEGNDTVTIKEKMFQIHPSGASDFEVEGEVVFAGYGIKSDKYNYNDLENIETEGRILLVMNRAPLSEDGSRILFSEPLWSSFMNIQWKLSYLLFSKASAILFVTDPKSCFSSMDEQYPGISGSLESSMYPENSRPMVFDLPGMPRIIFVHRVVADEILKGTGHTLEELQRTIDSGLNPVSFAVTGKKIKITEVSRTEEIIMHNAAAYIEGSDPDLKNEIVIFSAHADHIGTAGKYVNAGADDNASGCSALLEIADAFSKLVKKPLRTVLFLWFSGEEIGLLGSQSYTDNPLFPLEQTVANLNLDMIGRIKGVADSTADTPMTGPDMVYVITGDQSSELRSVAEEADKRSVLDFDYSLSGRNNPLQLFARSDHYNFVKNDIPVLFFSSGLHSDYHSPRDTVDKINFRKMELIARTIFDIGYTLANSRSRIVVDNPFSSW